MTLEEFIQEYDDTYVEVGGSANALNQCVDLANAWIMEGLGKDPIYNTNAKDFWTRADDSYERVTDRPPQKGDIVIWNVGAVGHIAVATGGDEGWFQSFDQNWPVGSPCHLVNHDYKNIVGFLRPKGAQMGFSDEQIKKNVEACVEALSTTMFGAERDWKPDAEYRFSEIQKGSVDTLKFQVQDYFKADSLYILKSEAQKIMDKELDQAQTICNNRVAAKEEEIKNLKADLEEMEGLLHTQTGMQQTQKQFSYVEFIKTLVNFFRKEK